MRDLQAHKINKPAFAINPRYALVDDARMTLAASLLLVLLIALGESRWPAETLPALRWLGVSLPRLLLGFAYVLFIPGYWLTAALFPAADDLDGIERLGLSLGMSVAWISVLGLILDRLPWGLRLWPIVLGELASTLIFMAPAFWRRARLPRGQGYAPPALRRPRLRWRGLPTVERRVYQLCVGALLVAGFAVASIFLIPSPDEFMTEFYILGREGLAEDYPRAAVPGETLTVTVGLRNRERAAHGYWVDVWVVDIWEDREVRVGQMGPFSLARDELFEQPAAWAMPWAGQDQQVEFRLYSTLQAGDVTVPYRLLRLWVNVKER